MSDDLQQVLSVINNASKEGKITSEEKLGIKEMILDGNPIVMDYVEEYKSSKDVDTFLKNLVDYIKLCESDDEDEKNRKAVEQMGSPDGDRLVNIKKKRGGQSKVDDFANIEECEEGLSPKVVFDKK